MAIHDVIAAIATAPGRGGIGVVRLSGPALDDLMLGICGRVLRPRSASLCDFRTARGEAIDQGLALYFPAPHSYTGEAVLELQGHGGPVVLNAVLARCLELGARLAQPGEFTRRAFLNGKMDLAQAEAVADLIDATTREAARSAQRSVQGAFSAAIQALARDLLALRALTEAVLDFPQEDLDPATRDNQADRLAALQAQMQRVLEASRQGSLLREGAVVVLAGQPNAGKSSLLNRLAGSEVAIVTEIPGTTRDAIRLSINLDGVPLHLVDTAGLRSSDDPVEREGIARTWAAVAEADLVLLVIDASRGETAAAADKAILAQLPPGLPCLYVYNKCDLLALTAPLPAASSAAQQVCLSAKTGAGLAELRRALAEAIGWQGDHGGEGVFMARARHLEALHAATAALRRAAAEGIGRTPRQELFAEELRLAHRALMGITGEVTADDLLGEIFSRFCIGK